MASGRVTIRDIAERIGVHPSTVSRVLNPETRNMVSPEVIAQVQDIAAELGYRPNPIAYGLRTNQSMTVGVVVPDLTNPVFPPTIRGIEDTLVASGYVPLLANSEGDQDREQLIVDLMRNRRVDGLILTTSSPNTPVILACKEDRLPLVVIHRTWDDPEISCVGFDDALGTNLIVQHLSSMGHEKFAYIAGPLDLTTGRDRHFGTINAMREFGVRVDQDLFAVVDSFDEEESRICCNELLSKGKEFTAIITGSDLIAAGCYAALREHGLRCPDDISITGYNDVPLATHLYPALTTIRTPRYETGAEAAKMMIERLNNREIPPRWVKFPPSLIIRDSAGPPKSAK
ncbi:MAG: LacI family transcriptional regulator [Rhodospirillaceae bacterium]|nr:LacI family transcriptional regulator [Rhodospirillaceae bacterium]|tara:strand:+ start:13050 stop:14081 length:1032 start_codon:yes stop_codon:yes gene_type:complete